jgi:hypothetical protein
MRQILGVFEARGLLHVNILRQIAMEKSIAHINLTECPSTRDSNGENQTNAPRLHNRAKSVTIINTLPLRKSTSNEASLVFLIRAIRVMFGFEYPFTANNVGARGLRNQCRCIGLRKSRKLIRHRITPSGLTKSIKMGHRSSKESPPLGIVLDGTISILLPASSVIMEESDHAMTRSKHGVSSQQSHG